MRRGDAREPRRRDAIGMAGVGGLLVAAGFIFDGWWTGVLPGVGLGLFIEAAVLARRGYPIGSRPPSEPPS